MTGFIHLGIETKELRRATVPREAVLCAAGNLEPASTWTWAGQTGGHLCVTGDGPVVSQGTFRPTSLLAPSLLYYTPAKGPRVRTVLSVAECGCTASEETGWEDSGAGVPPCPHGKSGSCAGATRSLVPSLGVRAFASHWESPSDPREAA